MYNPDPAVFSASKGTVLRRPDDGQIILTFTPTTAGLHQINLTLADSQQIHGFPISLEVVPAQADPSTTLVEMLDPVFIAGQPVELAIHWFDSFGNEITLAGNGEDLPHLDISISAEDERFNAAVAASNRSIYSITVTRAGPAKALCILPGHRSVLNDYDSNLPISQKEIYFSPSGFVAARSEAGGRGLTQATAGQLAEVTLWTFDAFGNDLNSSVAEMISIVASLQEQTTEDPSVFPCIHVEANRFNCSYIPTVAGNATLTVLTHVSIVHVSDGSAAANFSSATPEAYYRAGEPSNISIQLRDSAGNNRSAAEVNLSVGVSDDDVFIPAVYLDQGRYALPFVQPKLEVSPQLASSDLSASNCSTLRSFQTT